MKKEHEIILEILKYESSQNLTELICSKNANWITILGYLSYHRVAGLAYEKINNLNIRLLDFPVFFATYMINEAQKIRTIEQNKWIQKISEELICNNIRHAFLKGAVLSNSLFSYGSRASNDIDILINKKNIDDVTLILNKLGFIQGKYEYKKNIIQAATPEEINTCINTIGETIPFIKLSDIPTMKTIDVDINFSLDWNPNIDEKTIKLFLDNTILIKDNFNNSFYSLDYKHNFIELCMHLYKDSALIDIIQKRKVLDLYKFVDIYYFIKKYYDYLNIDELYGEIEKNGLEKYVYFAVSYVTKLFPDSKNEKIYKLLNKLNQDDQILNTIFDQYNPEIKMTTDTDYIERVFSYNLINNYKGEKND